MGQDLKLDFDKYCVVDGSPKTVLQSPRNSKTEKKKVRKKPESRNEVFLSQNNEFTEISFNRYRSASCKTVPSIRLEIDDLPRRGSVYQNSNEINKRNIINRIKENETECRKKIAVSRRNMVPFSSEIVETLCSSDDDNNSSLNMSTSSLNKENLSRKIPLNKSLSAKLATPHSPTKTESESSKTSPKTRFSPFRKMFDPFTKSKSQKSPLGSTIEEPSESTSSLRNVTLRKSLLNDFSNTDCDSQSVKKDSCSSMTSSSCSPAHLSGSLKLRNKNGVPYFEFSVKNLRDVWVAKKWKMEDGFNWVYTFHTCQNRRKSNVSGRGSKDYKNKEFIMMAQMQVSCYLCTQLNNSGNFMVTEFVLYNLSHPKESSNEIVDQPKVNGQSPWDVTDLHPDLESAAIVLEERKSQTQGKVSVVIPSGNHGLASDESQMVKPLLDRWRLGGGCDCGGWDMGCPLVVFGGPDNEMKKDEDCYEILFKGTKEKTPALTMKLTEEGQYAVDFHAKLSSLQAFAVCVAILHGTEASIAIGEDMNRQLSKCDSLRVFIEDEVKQLIEAVADNEKRKTSKNLDEIPPTFLVNPPFSPMSRA